VTNKYLSTLLELAEENGYDAIGYFDEHGNILGVSIGQPEFIGDIEKLLLNTTQFH